MVLIDYLIVIAYLGMVVIVGLVVQKKASSGINSYFLADRGLPWWALGASGMASNLDVSGTMINTAWVFVLGVSGLFLEIRGGVTLIMAFLMIFMGKWNRRAKVMTMAEWMRFRFGSGREGNMARIVSAFSVLIMTVAMITYFAIGSGKFISTFLKIPELGRIENSLDASEEKILNDILSDLELQQMLLDYDLETTNTRLSGKNTLDEEWKALHTAWKAVQDQPDRLYNLSRFRISINQFGKTVNRLSEKVKGSPGGSLHPVIVDDLLAFSACQRNLGIEFNRSVSYRVFLRNDWTAVLITPEFLAALIMIFLAMLYTVASGLYGVIWTDVFQGLLIFAMLIYVCVKAMMYFHLPETFAISIPMQDGTFRTLETTRDIWSSALPRFKLDFPEGSLYSIYNLFGVAVFFYLMKVTIEGCGGTSQYMIQRYYAAKSDRDAGLLSLFWTFLLSFRWPFIAAIAVMGIVHGTQKGVISDPEMVLPVVINDIIGVGVTGFLVAGLMAAAMSTFDSTVNAGAAYWVKDLYQAFINPGASEKKLMQHSRWSSVIIVILGVLFSLTVRNINEIWGWITMSIGAGMIIPTLLRWYWWRMNGYGYSIGIITGMIAAVVQKLFFPNVPEYVAFTFASALSLIGTIAGTYATRPTEQAVLNHFYKTTRPFGFWNPVRRNLSDQLVRKINTENRRDIISTFFAVPWQLVLFLMWMMVILKNWKSFYILTGILILLSVGLYFNWFRYLSSEVKVDDEKEGS